MTQEQALTILKTGANVFLTGEPGSGKTHTVLEYIQYLHQHDLRVAVTASTGIAATHLAGMTIHSWSGIGVRKSLTLRDKVLLQEKTPLVTRAQKTNVLIIDEISMLDASVLNTVDEALQTLRDSDEPFGGLQVIFVGDFFQLPPVSRDEVVEFAYTATSWKAVQPVICYLTEQHRHEDSQLADFLRAIRSGQEYLDEHSLLHSRRMEFDMSETITRLYSHNADVDGVNSAKLEAIEEERKEFTMTSKGRKNMIEQLQKGCLSPALLSLKVGAQVMFTKNNYESGFVNGTLGEVVGFNAEDLPIIKTKQGQHITAEPMEWQIEDNGKVLASITQLPLRLAWAITVHKSQGMTLDAAIIDLSRAFEYGQGYVALSRVRSSEGLYVIGFNERSLQVHPDIIQADQNFQQLSEKAEDRLNAYSEDALVKKHRNFILNHGGSLKKIAISDKKSAITTVDKTLALFNQGKSIAEIASERGLKENTIISHLEELVFGAQLEKEKILAEIPSKLAKKLPRIHKVLAKMEDNRLGPVYYALKGKFSYEELRLARMVR
ncbi:MAG: helix-turn-helix domain-containing protein [Patescibacteria group bacterium]